MTAADRSRWVRVLDMIADGMTQTEAANILHVSLRTVKNDLRYGRWVLDAKSTTHAVAVAIRNGRI